MCLCFFLFTLYVHMYVYTPPALSQILFFLLSCSHIVSVGCCAAIVPLFVIVFDIHSPLPPICTQYMRIRSSLSY